jgi:hypothetical protein
LSVNGSSPVGYRAGSAPVVGSLAKSIYERSYQLSQYVGDPSDMRPELQPIWTEYAKLAGEHTGWQEAAVYLRESKREQVEGYSPGAQLKGTLAEAARLHLWIPEDHVFLDLMSGRREDRVAFQDMLTLARSGKIAAVVVLHTSRFARNALVSRKYKDELRHRGVKVIAINAPFDVARPEGSQRPSIAMPGAESCLTPSSRPSSLTAPVDTPPDGSDLATSRAGASARESELPRGER